MSQQAAKKETSKSKPAVRVQKARTFTIWMNCAISLILLTNTDFIDFEFEKMQTFAFV